MRLVSWVFEHWGSSVIFFIEQMVIVKQPHYIYSLSIRFKIPWIKIFALKLRLLFIKCQAAADWKEIYQSPEMASGAIKININWWIVYKELLKDK